MNHYIIDELEDFLVAAKRNELVSVVVAATTRDGRSIASWEVHDTDVLDSLNFVRKCAEDGVDESYVLESDYEKNTAQGHQQTEVQAFQENVEPELREARPEAS